MQLDVRTVLVLEHPDRHRVLLLRRSPDKRLFPGLITGIGGRVELDRREAQDLELALWREINEELGTSAEQIQRLRLRLTTLLTRGDQQVILLWFTGMLRQVPASLNCSEGTLEFFQKDNLPLQ